MIYFDNAATSFPKPKRVIRATLRCIEKYCANPGRSLHPLAIITSEKVYEARECIARFVGIDSPECVVFCENATHALNLAIKTTVAENSHVLISDLEHNSVLRPINALRDAGVSYSVFRSDAPEQSIEALLQPNTGYIISSAASNVIGRRMDIKLLSEIAKKHGLAYIMDASQLIGHSEINLRDVPADVLCAPGHKGLFGIQGVGFAIFNDGKAREPFMYGGSGNDSKSLDMPEKLPERQEAGTLPSPSIISLCEGIRFIEEIGIKNVEDKIAYLTDRCADIISGIKNTVVYEHGNGIVSFNVLNCPAEMISGELSRCGVCTRCGLHCAPLAHKTIGTQDIGTVRVSLSYLNNKGELDKFYKILRSICKAV